MSKTRGLDADGDWTFGKGFANYKRKDDEIAQNVQTRIKSFKNDWFLDTEANIDWFSILGNKNNEETIKLEVTRVTKATNGVLRVNSVDIIEVDPINRKASIVIDFDTINNTNLKKQIGID